MSTLADELLADFDDSGSEGEADVENGGLFQDEEKQDTGLKSLTDPMDLDGDEEDVGEEDEEMAGMAKDGVEPVEDEADSKARIEKMELKGVDDVSNVATLMKTLSPILEKIKHFQSQPQSDQQNIGNVEDNPEYHVLTDANTSSTKIDNEIVLVHKFLRDHYSKRFPELETLVNNPLSYAKAVKLIGNGPMDGTSMHALRDRKENSLKSILDGPSSMMVVLEATTTKGTDMAPQEIDRVMRACDMMISLDQAKGTLTNYVQSRMNLFAPNLTALIGSLTAAQLLNVAGGLTALAKTPACNLSALGNKKQAIAGLATNVGIRQQGYLYHSPIIQSIPSDLKRQAMRIVSAKIVLAARVDRVHSSTDGRTGEELKASCLERLEKLTEPPKNKGARALPAPDDKPARKRGGRRARKAKEATAMTDLRKAQNRMVFGREEKEAGYGTGEGTIGMGMIGAANNGRIRNLQIDQRTKAKLSAKNKGWGGATPVSGSASSLRGFGQSQGSVSNGLRTSGIGSVIGGSSGTASSIAFTPVQGLELVDPKRVAEMNRKRKAEDDKWFNSGTFTQVGSASNGPTTTKTNGDFKKPDLPAAKRVDTGRGKMLPPALPGK